MWAVKIRFRCMGMRMLVKDEDGEETAAAAQDGGAKNENDDGEEEDIVLEFNVCIDN
jgi:hypothetical protein